MSTATAVLTGAPLWLLAALPLFCGLRRLLRWLGQEQFVRRETRNLDMEHAELIAGGQHER